MRTLIPLQPPQKDQINLLERYAGTLWAVGGGGEVCEIRESDTVTGWRNVHGCYYPAVTGECGGGGGGGVGDWFEGCESGGVVGAEDGWLKKKRK